MTEDNDFLNEAVYLGLVLKGRAKDIIAFKKNMEHSIGDLQVYYVRTSAGKLYISNVPPFRS